MVELELYSLSAKFHFAEEEILTKSCQSARSGLKKDYGNAIIVNPKPRSFSERTIAASNEPIAGRKSRKLRS